MGIFRQFPYSNFHDMNMDELIKVVRELADDWTAYNLKWENLYTDTQQALEDFKQYVIDYFNSLDLSEEVRTQVNNTIRTMVQDGSFNTIILTQLSPVVTSWLKQNITVPEGVVIDSSLSIAGAAADAKAAGDIKLGVNNILESYAKVVATKADNTDYVMDAGYILGSDGTLIQVSDTLYQVTHPMPVEYGQMVFVKETRSRFNNKNWSFFNASMQPIKSNVKTSSGVLELYNEMLWVPFGAAYFVAASDRHDHENGMLPNAYVVTGYSENIDTVHDPLDYNVSPDLMAITDLEVTKRISRILSKDAFDIAVAGDPQIDFSVSRCSVEAGTYINILNAAARYTNIEYAFYDVVDNPLYIEPRADNDIHNYTFIKVPYGAVTLKVSGYQSTPSVQRIDALNLEGGEAGSSWSNKVWACMGDSLTDANNARASKRYFNYIQDMTGIQVVNLGKSGTGYMKPYEGNKPFYQRVNTIPVNADVITIFGSGNDCSLELGDPTDTGTTTVCGCINTTIDAIRARITGANIGIISPTPWDDYPTYTDNAMSRYCEALEEICSLKGVPFLNLYRCSNMLPWEAAFRNKYYKNDDGNGVHPDSDGHRFFTPHIYAFMRSLLM